MSLSASMPTTEVNALRVASSHTSLTLASIRALATTGQEVDKSDLWTMSVSAALHAAG